MTTTIPPRFVPMVVLLVWFAAVLLVGGMLPLWLLNGGPSLCGR